MVETILISSAIVLLGIASIVITIVYHNRRGTDSVRIKLDTATERNTELGQAITNAESGTQESIATTGRISDIVADSTEIIKRVRKRKVQD